MKYLVTMEMIEEHMPKDPQQMVQHMERVIAQHEIQLKLVKEGKILYAGMPVGKKTDIFIADVASNDELNELMMDLPNWHLMKVDVSPLMDYKGTDLKIRQNIEQMKTMMK